MKRKSRKRKLKMIDVNCPKCGAAINPDAEEGDTTRYVSTGFDGVVLRKGVQTSLDFLNPRAARERVTTYEPILQKKKVLIVGGGVADYEAARVLAICHSNKDMLELLLPFHNVEIMTSAKVKGYKNGTLSVETAEGTKELACDSVILSVGYNEENSLYHEVEFEVANHI